MKLLYFDCSMGAAGDMITASLLSLYPHPEEILPRLNAIGIPNVTYTLLRGENCGISGLMMRVLIGGKEEKSWTMKPLRAFLLRALYQPGTQGIMSTTMNIHTIMNTGNLGITTITIPIITCPISKPL